MRWCEPPLRTRDNAEYLLSARQWRLAAKRPRFPILARYECRGPGSLRS